jgi:hypothetical protein
VIAAEALPEAAAACELLPSVLGKQIGDVAALMAALTDPSVRSKLNCDPNHAAQEANGNE